MSPLLLPVVASYSPVKINTHELAGITSIAEDFGRVNSAYSLSQNVTGAFTVPSKENVTEGTMVDEEMMTVDERRKYLRRMQHRYRKAARAEKARLLDEMGAVTALHRKSLVRLLHPGGLERRSRRRQRGRIYGPAVDEALRVIWESLDYVCAERLTPALVSTAQVLAQHGELRLTADLMSHLEQISVSTVQRRLTWLALDTPRLPRRGPERANQVARTIPTGRIPWDIQEPGHFEVDTVHHCGGTASGEYVHTIQLVDVATGWSERVAVLGRSQRQMEAGFQCLQARLPFPIRELHPDSGSEFLNDHLVRCWRDSVPGLTLSRSRPWHKNDNRHVEQKNATLVRAYLGHWRLDTWEHCAALNALYDQMWLYYNLFQPVLHLVEKTVQGTRVCRKWGPAQTPFERVLATGVLTPAQQTKLTQLRSQTNPRTLRREIYARRDHLLAGLLGFQEVAAA